MSQPEEISTSNGHGPEVPGQLCQWYATCSNPATTELEHPVLGKVPICERCQKLVAKIEAEEDNPE